MLKKLVFLLLILSLLASGVQSAAVDFTGTFSDSGRDTDTDGKYNYLDLNVNINVNTAGEYDFYAIIDKDGANFIEARNRVSLATGNKNVVLSFDGIEIYSRKIDGPYNLNHIEITKPSQQGFPEKIAELNDAYDTGVYSYSQFQVPTGAAAIYCTSSPCVAPSSLIYSRDNIIGAAEPNSPNTIDGCEDGSKGIYLSDESIENITVTSLYGDNFRGGDLVRVDFTVYCWSASDRLNFVYANETNHPQWRVVGYKYCSSAGFNVLSKEFYLDDKSGSHTIRGVFQNGGSVTDTCGKGDYDDNDDVNILVNDAVCYDSDGDGYGNPGSSLCVFQGEDCKDDDASINPGAKEVCFNGIDDNCNGLIDYNDPECRQNSIQLKKGWNLVSIAYNLDDNSLPNALSSIEGMYNSIYTYEGGWKFFDPTNIINSNLFNLNPSLGYWIDMKQAATLYISGTNLDKINYDLKEGWNLISYPNDVSSDINSELVLVAGNYETFVGYTDRWLTYSESNPRNSLNNLEFDSAYFVKVDSDQTWAYNQGYKLVDGMLRYRIEMPKGWNMFSLPVDITDNSIDNALGSIEGCYNAIWTKDGDGWKSSENYFNPLSKIDHNHAYLIDMNEKCTLDVEGILLNEISINLTSGWNLVPWPSYISEDIESVFEGLNYSIIWTTQNGVWKSTSDLLPLTKLEPTNGYQVYMNEAAEIIIN